MRPDAYRRRKRDHLPIDGQPPTSRLLLACPDQPGLIAAVSGFLADAGRNIVDADQHSSNEGRFFMRMAFDPAPEDERAELYDRFAREIAGPLRMEHRFAESNERQRLAIMVSREDHCLSDLLWRWRSDELGAEVVAVVSNHTDHADQVASLGLRGGVEGHPHEEAPLVARVLVGVEDVAAVVGEEAADRGDQPGLIGTGEEQARGGGLAVDRKMIALVAAVRIEAGKTWSRFEPHSGSNLDHVRRIAFRRWPEPPAACLRWCGFARVREQCAGDHPAGPRIPQRSRACSQNAHIPSTHI